MVQGGMCWSCCPLTWDEVYHPLPKDEDLHHRAVQDGVCPSDRPDLAADTSVDKLGTWHKDEGTRSVLIQSNSLACQQKCVCGKG